MFARNHHLAFLVSTTLLAIGLAYSPAAAQNTEEPSKMPASGGSGQALIAQAEANTIPVADAPLFPTPQTDLGLPLSVKGFGPTITVPWSSEPPTIDGFIEPLEWLDATSRDISVRDHPVRMFLKHDGAFLYVAVDDQNDGNQDALDQIALYFDDEGGSSPTLHDNAWEETSCPGDEGSFWLGNFPAWPPGDGFRSIVSDTDQAYIFCDPQWGNTFVTIEFGPHTGSMHYEAAVDLSLSKLRAEPGESFGWYVLSFDKYVVDDIDQYAKVTGRWPETADYWIPSQYGNLTLEPVPPPDGLHVTSLDDGEFLFFCDDAVKPPLTIYQDYGLWWRNVTDGLPGESGYQYQGFPWDSCTGDPPFDFEFPTPEGEDLVHRVQFTPTGTGTACYRARSWQENGAKTYSDWSPCCCMEVVEAACVTLGTPTVTEVGDTTCGGSTSVTTPELRWADVRDEDGYRWQVRDTAGTAVVSGEAARNQVFAMVDKLEPGAYTARVQARGDGQSFCDGDWSADCPFTVEAEVHNSTDFTWWPGQPKQGERVRFADLSSNGSFSWQWDFGDGWTSTEQHPIHVFESTGTFRVLLNVEFESGQIIEEKTITVSGVVQCGNDSCESSETAWSCPADCALEPDETGRAGGSDRRSTMPAAAGGVSGAGGTLWKTQAIVYNPGSEPVTIIVEFTPRNKTLILQEDPFELEPGRSMSWDNIIEELFDRTGSGGLWIDASEPVLFLTRTYTENPTTKKTGGGTFGEGRYASREVFSLGLGDGKVYLIGLQHDDDFRSNLYFQEVDGSEVKLEVEIFDNSGLRLRRRLVNVDGHSSKLRNLKDLGADGVHSAYATVEVVEGDGRVAVGGSVIDNITGDPTALDAIHPSQVAKKFANEQHFLVAAIAHTTGTRQSVWRSGLTILNPTSVSQNVTVRYEVEVDRTGVIGEFLEKSVTISAGQQLDWKDVLVEFFGAPENAKTQGALHVFSSDSLMVNSRTYNERSDGGTFGLGLPGLKSGDLVSSEGGRGIIVGLKNSGGTRTNIGLAEYSGEETEVNIFFYTTEQENLFLNRNDPVEPVVPANSHFQILNIFQQIESLKEVQFEKVKAEVVVENGGLIYSYATTIDNDSGDPTAFTTAKE